MTAAPAGGPCVLVVDDEGPIRRALEINLAARDFRVALAASGEEALRVAASAHPDLVLLDLGLPGIDGLRAQAGNGATRHGDEGDDAPRAAHTCPSQRHFPPPGVGAGTGSDFMRSRYSGSVVSAPPRAASTGRPTRAANSCMKGLSPGR